MHLHSRVSTGISRKGKASTPSLQCADDTCMGEDKEEEKIFAVAQPDEASEMVHPIYGCET